MLKKSYLLWGWVMLGICACNKPPLYIEYRNYDGYWPAAEKAVFPLDDVTQEPVNMMIHIRNNREYPFSNLFLIASLKLGDSLVACDTLEYAMADPQGAWLGSGYMEVKESKLWWKENYELPVAENLKVELEHALRYNGSEAGMDPLEGIVSVGFAVEEMATNE
ncbi:MAG: gliding motility lipoprotein GldH [Flavobacteriaceae bacterium]